MSTPWDPTAEDLAALRDAMRRAGVARLELELGGTTVRLELAATAGAPASAPPEPAPAPTLDSDGPGVLRLADPAGGAPFVRAGDAVAEGQLIALLQAGAALWPVHATRAGTVAQVLAEDGTLVGYGTPLVRLDR